MKKSRKDQNADIKIVKERWDGTCPNCNGNKWLEGPSGGLSVNIMCAECGLWFNRTPFGIDYIGRKGHEKLWKWYCPKCKELCYNISGNTYGVYPKCGTCHTELKTCTLYKNYKNSFCEDCDYRFNCYTEK